MIQLLLRHDAAGAKKVDVEGYLPLHYLALCSGRSRESDSEKGQGETDEANQLWERDQVLGLQVSGHCI